MKLFRRRSLLLLSMIFAIPVYAQETAPTAGGPISFARIDELTGRLRAPETDAARWRQAVFEVRRAEEAPDVLPPMASIREAVVERVKDGVIPIGVLDAPRPDAVEGGATRVFAAAALRERTYHGAETRFVLDRERYMSPDGAPGRVAIDFDDGLGFREVEFGAPVPVRYDETGRKTIRLTARSADGVFRHASFPFVVKALRAPLPNDTLAITATEPYLGVYGTGEAYVYLSALHATLTNPVVVIEGFDLDNSLNWDELYALLNQENLVERLRAEGFDAVVLNFTDAVDYVQRNALVIEAALGQVESMIAPGQTYPLIGASMGGLASRYALDHMESQSTPNRVRTFISFDAPQKGADIPLGLQYWLSFFSGLSTDAEFLLSRLDTPAARQMLVYHYTDPPASTPGSDSLKGALDAELASLGGWPSGPRLVSIVNGSGAGTNQGFSAGEQIIRYEYSSLFVSITGNVWAVPDGGPSTIFDGNIRIILPTDQLTVTVNGTKPYDGAPGGYRSSMADMDAVQAPYGDIIALHPSHCFIPTISALALNTEDLFYDVDGDPNLLGLTPFDAVYFPVENQEHVTITPESAEWFLGEIRDVSTGVAAGEAEAPRLVTLRGNRPNPFNPTTTIRFDLAGPSRVILKVYDSAGREVSTLLNGAAASGTNEARFDGAGFASGVYFYRLRAGDVDETGKMTLVR